MSYNHTATIQNICTTSKLRPRPKPSRYGSAVSSQLRQLDFPILRLFLSRGGACSGTLVFWERNRQQFKLEYLLMVTMFYSLVRPLFFALDSGM
jgi:hypothetical protein